VGELASRTGKLDAGHGMLDPDHDTPARSATARPKEKERVAGRANSRTLDRVDMT
jgi:hypothetical protein